MIIIVIGLSNSSHRINTISKLTLFDVLTERKHIILKYNEVYGECIKNIYDVIKIKDLVDIVEEYYVLIKKI